MCLSRGSFFKLGGYGAMVPFCCSSESDPAVHPASVVADVPTAAAVGLLGLALEFCADWHRRPASAELIFAIGVNLVTVE